MTHEAQCMPFIENVFFVCILFDYYFSVVHVHAAGIYEFAASLRRELDRNFLVQWQLLAYPEIAEHHFFKACLRIFADKIEFGGLPFRYRNSFGGVSAVDNYVYRIRNLDFFFFICKKEPIGKPYTNDTSNENNNLIDTHMFALCSTL